MEEVDEPKVKWAKSKARKLPYIDILKRRVSRQAKDEKGKRTAKLRDIYLSRVKFQEYHYSKFSWRVGALRNAINEKMARKKELDQQAYEIYIENHPIS